MDLENGEHGKEAGHDARRHVAEGCGEEITAD